MRPLLVVVLLALCVAACRQAGKGKTEGAGGTPTPAEAALHAQLNPALQPVPLPAASLAAPPAPNPVTIFPVPIRPWIPPAETPDQPRLLAGDHRIANSAPAPSGEIPLFAPLISQPDRVILPAGPLARADSRDPASLAAWVAINPVTETRGQPPKWDRPLITTDPTAEISSMDAAAPTTGLRETPPPFLRLNIPDPFEQISIAELRNPPAENDAPVAPFTRPGIQFVETPAAQSAAK
jgi:hypothetical protein